MKDTFRELDRRLKNMDTGITHFAETLLRLHKEQVAKEVARANKIRAHKGTRADDPGKTTAEHTDI
jgi:hypothetical protein